MNLGTQMSWKNAIKFSSILRGLGPARDIVWDIE